MDEFKDEEEAILNKIKYKVLESKLGDVDKDIIPLLHQYLKIYMKSVIRTLVQHRMKYDVIDPLLKPVQEAKEKNESVQKKNSAHNNNKDPMQEYIKTEVLFNDDPFTAKDLLECYKECPQIIPRRNIFQVHILYATSVMNNAEKRPKKMKILENIPMIEMK